MTGPVKQTLKLTQIVRKSEFQTRVKDIDLDKVDEYKARLEAGETPAKNMSVFVLDGEYVLVGGHHRFNAYAAADRTEAEFDIYEGTPSEALWFAIGDNRDNGLSLTVSDKRANAFAILRDNFLAEHMSNRDIARQVGLQHAAIGDYKKQIASEIQNDTKQHENARVVDSTTGTLGQQESGSDEQEPKSDQEWSEDDEPATVQFPAQETAAVPETLPAPLKDKFGQAVPYELTETFEKANWWSEQIKTINRIIDDTYEQCKFPQSNSMSAATIENKLASAADTAFKGKPYAICPFCQGFPAQRPRHNSGQEKTCKDLGLNAKCRGFGWLNHDMYGCLTRADREWCERFEEGKKAARDESKRAAAAEARKAA